MKKKITAVLLAGLLGVSILLGCSSGNTGGGKEDLSGIKLAAVNGLVFYVNDLQNENYYSDAGYEKLTDYLEEGTTKINNAASEETISEISKETKEKMDSVETKNVQGTFYTLQQAYDSGYINRNDLQAMAKLVNANEEKDVQEMPQKALKAIKRNYAELRNSNVEEVCLKYYGEYNGYTAITVHLKEDSVMDAEKIVVIDTVEIRYSCIGIEITIWK